MELINKNVIENRHFKIVAKVIRDILHKKENDTVYEAFKSHLIFLGESIMKNYLEETGLIKDKRFKEFSFASKKLPYKILGRHSKGNIVIDNKVIEGLYNGNVVKRSAKELRELLNTETDNQKKEFISRLISKRINIENLYSEIVQASNGNLQVPRKKIKKFV